MSVRAVVFSFIILFLDNTWLREIEVKGLGKGKIVSLEDRVPKLKQQRRRKANKRLIFLLLLFFTLISCVVYFQSPLSHVNKIRVVGNKAYTTDQLIAQTGLTKQTNIWRIDKKKIATKLKALSEVKSAKLKREFPNNFLITIKEWDRIAYMMKDGFFWPILENGEILKQETSMIPVNSPVLMGFSGGEATEEMIAALNQLPTEVLNSISEIHHTPKETDKLHITLYMNDGFEVSATIRSFAEKMAHYPAIVSQLDPNVKGVIDMELGPYFRPYQLEDANEENDNNEEER